MPKLQPRTTNLIDNIKQYAEIDTKTQLNGHETEYCQRHFKTINATKDLAHVLKKPGHHVKSCKSTIPNQYLERYVNLEKSINDKKNARDNASEKLNAELTKRNHNVTINVTNNSKRRCVDKLVSQPTISDTVRPNSYQTTM